jgi:phage gp36-like protein
MAYSTPAMVRNAVNPTGDGSQPSPANTRTAADLSDAELADFIAEADAQIDAYIGGYYAVPVAPVASGDVLGDGAAVGAIPHPIDYWSRNLALYFATLAIRKSQDFADTDPVARRYNGTISALKQIAAGQLRLSLPDNTSGAAGAGVGSALNPTYSGNLFDARDFNLHPINEVWPLWPDNPGRPW